MDKYIGGNRGGGWRRPWFVVLAARPSVGKTTFAINLMRRLEVPRLFLSLEMSLPELLEEVQKAEVRRPEDLYYIDDVRALPDLCNAIAGAGQTGIQFVVLDYINLVQLGAGQEMDNAGMTSVSHQLRAAARNNGVVLLAIAQLNRQCEGRYDQRPRMSDLRDSGTIEQDADCILMLYSEAYHNPSDPRASNAVELIIEKQRQGRRGVTLFFDFDRERATFVELTRELNVLMAPRDAARERERAAARAEPDPAPGRTRMRQLLQGND